MKIGPTLSSELHGEFFLSGECIELVISTWFELDISWSSPSMDGVTR